MELYFCKNKDNKNLNISDNIIIIGSSSSVLRNKLGENINQFKSIVRFNRSPIDSYEEYVGNRTDLRILNNHVSLNVKLKSNEFSNSPQSFIPSIKNSKILIIGPGVNLYAVHKTLDSSNDIYLFDYSKISQLKSNLKIHKLNKQMSVGFCFMCLTILSGFKPTIYGFDFNNQSRTHYWEDRIKHSAAHSINDESLYMQEFINEDKIKLL